MNDITAKITPEVLGEDNKEYENDVADHGENTEEEMTADADD